METIHCLIDALLAHGAAVWEDKAGIDLNPRIGFDPGMQRRVMAPGKNVKRSIAGAMDAQTDRVIWGNFERKNGRLFIDLLKKLLIEYANREVGIATGLAAPAATSLAGSRAGAERSRGDGIAQGRFHLSLVTDGNGG